MGIREYFQSQDIAYQNYDFEAIIMAALRQADTENYAKLQEAFPEIQDELMRRYNATGGVLDRSEVRFAAKRLKIKESEFHNIPE